jgi:hypothetical protein
MRKITIPSSLIYSSKILSRVKIEALRLQWSNQTKTIYEPFLFVPGSSSASSAMLR